MRGEGKREGREGEGRGGGERVGRGKEREDERAGEEKREG